jgi:hypothetical protein
MSVEPSNHTPAVVAGRYRVGEALGRGGASTVFAAVDLLTGREVALKHMRLGDGVSLARARLEIAILRRLQRPALLPGVARLLDDGGDDDHAWLVMERIEGSPFPGRSCPASWDDVRAVTLALLETLVELHAANVVHLDLKPDNVLVDRHDRPVIVDFGIAASGDGFEQGITETMVVRGTSEYLAPERLRGERGPRADLYALGVMLFHTLSGQSPWRDDGSLRALGPDVPLEVAELVARLVSRRPAERPASAREVLAALRGAGSSRGLPKLGVREAPWTLDALAARIAGPERLLHLPSDAAALLLARSRRGDPRDVDAELARWLHARLATFDGERVHVPRASIDALSTRAARRRETPLGWIARARRHLEHGRHARAEPLVRDALRAAAAPPRDERLLARAAKLGVSLVIAARDRSATARFVYELSRIEPKPAVITAIEALARAHDEAIHWTADALERARAVLPFEDRELETLRLGVRVFAARKISIEVLRDEVEHVLRASRSRHPSWARCRAVALGRLRYVEERYVDAAACHEEAAALSRWPAARLDALLNAASARMEAFELERAMELAAEARTEARAARLAFFEGRAEWIWRSAADRARIALEPDLELVDAARHLDAPDLVLILAVNEATLAFRRGDRVTFARLASIARDACGLDNEPLGMATIDALEIALGLRKAEARHLELADRLAARGVPRLALEVAALIEGRRPRSVDRAEWLLALAATVPTELRDHRLGVLSVNEALDRLGLAPAIQSLRN